MTSIVIVVSALLSVVAALPLDDKAQPLIVNGYLVPDTGDKVTPWMASLQTRNRVGAFCGGTIIDQYWILTAAHCVYNPRTNRVWDEPDIEVFVGSTKMRGPHFITSPVRKIEVHPRYIFDLRGSSDDIALIQTTLPLTKPGQSRTAVMPLASPEDAKPGDAALIAGFGRVSFMGQQPQNLLYANFQVASPDVCLRSYGRVFAPASMVCTGGTYSSGQGVNQGDSGGGLIVKNSKGQKVVSGIASFTNIIMASVPASFTRVSYYLDWIEKVTKVTSS